jgi:hypothetical protein
LERDLLRLSGSVSVVDSASGMEGFVWSIHRRGWCEMIVSLCKRRLNFISLRGIAGDGMYAVGIVWSLMTWGFAV